MTEQQIKWAAQHDWFVSVAGDGEGVLVSDVSLDTRMGEIFTETKAFRDYRTLRRWAGY